MPVPMASSDARKAVGVSARSWEIRARRSVGKSRVVLWVIPKGGVVSTLQSGPDQTTFASSTLEGTHAHANDEREAKQGKIKEVCAHSDAPPRACGGNARARGGRPARGASPPAPGAGRRCVRGGPRRTRSAPSGAAHPTRGRGDTPPRCRPAALVAVIDSRRRPPAAGCIPRSLWCRSLRRG